MSNMDKLEELNNKKIEMDARIKELEGKWEGIEDELDELEYAKEEIERGIKRIVEENEEKSYEYWKGQLTEDEQKVRPYTFELTQEQTLKIKYLEQLHAKKYNGAIGGGTTVSFTLTSIGDIVSVTINGKDYNLTDYSNI